MNPFELTKDPDGGGITVRVKHGFVVLTREEERRVTERITEILAENAKLRETLCDIADHIKSDDGYGIDRGWVLERIRETGIEVPE